MQVCRNYSCFFLVRLAPVDLPYHIPLKHVASYSISPFTILNISFRAMSVLQKWHEKFPVCSSRIHADDLLFNPTHNLILFFFLFLLNKSKYAT